MIYAFVKAVKLVDLQQTKRNKTIVLNESEAHRTFCSQSMKSELINTFFHKPSFPHDKLKKVTNDARYDDIHTALG